MRKYATAQELTETDAVRTGMEQKAREFTEASAEIYPVTPKPWLPLGLALLVLWPFVVLSVPANSEPERPYLVIEETTLLTGNMLPNRDRIFPSSGYQLIS